MTNQAKPTPGPVEICTCLHGLYRVDIMAHEGRKSVATVVVKRPPVNRDMEAENDPEGWANAHLIAEAFNVHHETGLTPRELQEQRYLLREVLHGELEALRKDIAALISPGSTLLHHRYDRIKEVLSQTAPPRQAANAKGTTS